MYVERALCHGFSQRAYQTSTTTTMPVSCTAIGCTQRFQKGVLFFIDDQRSSADSGTEQEGQAERSIREENVLRVRVGWMDDGLWLDTFFYFTILWLQEGNVIKLSWIYLLSLRNIPLTQLRGVRFCFREGSQALSYNILNEE